MRRRSLIYGLGAPVLLFVAVGLFWYFRVLESGTEKGIDLGIVDLYTEHMPVVQYAFEELRNGHLPLWNPYQFCGTPFLAMGWTGIFYPPQLVNLVLDVPIALEALFLFHMFLGALGMWWLARRLGISVLGGLCAALTFVWSGWLTHHVNAPAILGSMTWMPLIILLLDGVALGRRFAWLGLIGALTCQLLLGLIEIVLHTAYLGAVFLLCRLILVGREHGWMVALRRGGVVAVSAFAALLLSMPNTLPLVELVQQSTRAVGALSFEQVWLGALPPLLFLRSAMQPSDWVWMGVLPLIAAPIALSLRPNRVFWVGALIVALASASLVFGGVAFQLYYRIPIVGGLFRRPMKFLDLYTFAQALLTGAAVTCLQAWAHETPHRLWQHPAWLAALGFAAAVSIGLYTFAISNWYVVGALGALVLFGLVRAPAVRLGLVGVLCLIQAASLFFSAGDTHLRPLRRPRLLQTYDPLFASLAAGLGDGRIYLSPQFMFLPGLTHKQGTLQRLSVVVDYEPLATSRYGRFFAAVSPGSDQQAPFAGSYPLTESSRWRLMDLTGTRFFVMVASDPGASYMAGNSAEFERVWQRGVVRVYRRRTPLPRAFVVARARVLPTPDDVLIALQAPDFDPRAEVLLEEDPEGGASPTAAAGPPGDVTMTPYTQEYV